MSAGSSIRFDVGMGLKRHIPIGSLDNRQERKTAVIPRLFLCHYRGDASHVHELAEELRLHGIVPWLDRDGGFAIGDNNMEEARRAIREECFGLLFYATLKAFTRDFIRKVELDEAVRCKERDAEYLVLAVPVGIDFPDLARLSTTIFGIDLAGYDTRTVGPGAVEAHISERLDAYQDVARGLVDRVVGHLPRMETLGFQYSTRERLADSPNDALCLDAVSLIERSSGSDAEPEAWARVHSGLLSIKHSISRHHGRPRLRVHGSKHLTAAFILGFAFPTTSFDLEVRVKEGYWSTDCSAAITTLLQARQFPGSLDSNALYVEISTGGQPVREGVRRYVQQTGKNPFRYLRLETEGTCSRLLGNADACAMALQVRSEIQAALRDYPVEEIHLFAAIPQGLATFVAHHLRAMPAIHLYEYANGEYRPSYTVNTSGKGSPG